MPTCNVDKMLGIYQICFNCCLPASIENVIRYYGGDFSQRKFLNEFLQGHNLHDLSFESAKIFLDQKPEFSDHFTFEVKSVNEHKDVSGLQIYIEDCIKHDAPVIVAIKSPVGAHIVTVFYKEGTKIAYFDPHPVIGKSEFLNINEIEFSQGLGTLVIRRK
jgi:hypothetical protein